MYYKTPDNLRFFYETAGNPQVSPILLIYGLGADHRMWQPQITPFVEAGFFVITPDIRSHGQSEIG